MMTATATKRRFGIARQDGTPGGHYWELRVPVSGEDVYIQESATKTFVHASLHASGQWHVKARDGRTKGYVRHLVPRPAEQWPNLTLAYSIAAPSTWGASGTRQADPRANVVWTRPPGSDAFVVFDVFIDRRGKAPAQWPGYSSMGTDLVARAVLRDGAEVLTVAHLEHDPMKMQIPDTPENRALLQAYASRPLTATQRMCMWGADDRGAIRFVYGYGFA